MKTVDFFKVVIKIFGIIILLFDPYGVVVNLFSEIFRPDKEVYIIAFLLLSLSIILFLSYCCLFKTESIVTLLQLNKSISNNIDVKGITANYLLLVSIFIIGGILIVYSFSSVFIGLIYTLAGKLSEKIALSTSNDIDYNLLINTFDLAIGVIMISNTKKIATYLCKKIE